MKQIQSEEEYEKILKRIDKIFDAEPGTKEGDELKHLCSVVQDYEQKNYPIPEPDKESVEEFMDDQLFCEKQKNSWRSKFTKRQ